MPISQETIDKIKAAMPGVELEVLVHPTLPDEVLGRIPPKGVYAIYLQLLNDPLRRIEAAEALCKGSIVYPTGPELDKMFDAHPALPRVFADELAEMAGATLKASRKKV